MVGIPMHSARVRRTAAVLVALAATLAIAAGPATASTPGPAACQEYSVCGGPTGGSGNVSLGAPAPRRSHPSVGARTSLPLTGYPLTPALAILAAIVAAALGLCAVLAVARRGRRVAATSAPGR